MDFLGQRVALHRILQHLGGGMPESPEKRTSMCNCPPDKVFTRNAQRRTASLRPGILSGQAAARRKCVWGALAG